MCISASFVQGEQEAGTASWPALRGLTGTSGGSPSSQVAQVTQCHAVCDELQPLKSPPIPRNRFKKKSPS
jgi:hypothetical protein